MMMGLRRIIDGIQRMMRMIPLVVTCASIFAPDTTLIIGNLIVANLLLHSGLLGGAAQFIFHLLVFG